MWPANRREERSGGSWWYKPLFHRWQLSQHFEKSGLRTYSLCAMTADSGVRLAHPFLSPPPLRGGPALLAHCLKPLRNRWMGV
jgi:hypothetical protein